MTAAAARRSWAEPPVRAPMLVGVILLLVLVGYVVTQVVEAQSDRTLVLNGTRVDAYLISVDGSPLKLNVSRTLPLEVEIRYSVPGSDQEFVQKRILDRGEGLLSAGGILPIRVDPLDPQRWTDKLEPIPWTRQLLMSPGLLLVALAPLSLAVLQRRRMVRQYRTGTQAIATVGDSTHSPLFPASRRYTVTVPGDELVYSVMLPSKRGTLEAGQPVAILYTPGRPTALAADLYASPA